MQPTAHEPTPEEPAARSAEREQVKGAHAGEAVQRNTPNDTISSAASLEKLIRLTRVLEMTGRGRTATLDDVRAGRFPQPIKLGSATVWVESEVQAWIAERVRKARGQA